LVKRPSKIRNVRSKIVLNGHLVRPLTGCYFEACTRIVCILRISSKCGTLKHFCLLLSTISISDSYSPRRHVNLTAFLFQRTSTWWCLHLQIQSHEQFLWKSLLIISPPLSTILSKTRDLKTVLVDFFCIKHDQIYQWLLHFIGKQCRQFHMSKRAESSVSKANSYTFFERVPHFDEIRSMTTQNGQT